MKKLLRTITKTRNYIQQNKMQFNTELRADIDYNHRWLKHTICHNYHNYMIKLLLKTAYVLSADVRVNNINQILLKRCHFYKTLQHRPITYQHIAIGIRLIW